MQGCGIKGFIPTSVIQGNPRFYDQISLWQALSIVSQKWSFPTALLWCALVLEAISSFNQTGGVFARRHYASLNRYGVVSKWLDRPKWVVVLWLLQPQKREPLKKTPPTTMFGCLVLRDGLGWLPHQDKSYTGQCKPGHVILSGREPKSSELAGGKLRHVSAFMAGSHAFAKRAHHGKDPLLGDCLWQVLEFE